MPGSPWLAHGAGVCHGAARPRVPALGLRVCWDRVSPSATLRHLHVLAAKISRKPGSWGDIKYSALK